MTVDNTDYHKVKKMSTSLTSLQLNSQSLERQRHVRKTTERLYNSLTKRRKDPKQTNVQRMWINHEDCKNEFWAAIRAYYEFLMDTNLIDTCKEANGELVWDKTDVSTQPWNLKDVSRQFSELYSWLRILQDLVYSKEENLLDKSLRAAHMEELQREAYRRKLFNEQAEKLISRAPALKDEVAWRVDHLNAKWELVEQIMAPIDQPVSSQQDISADFEREVKYLKKWLREMESRLRPLKFQINWTLPELEEKALEHMVLQRDIKAHGRIVSSIVKLGDKISTQQQQSEQQHHSARSPLRTVKWLERRWQLLFLGALEWQCHIETLASHIRNKNIVPYRSSSDSDEEPVTKQPRLSCRRSRSSGTESPPSQSARSTRTERAKRVGRSRSKHWDLPVSARTDFFDSEVSSENRSVDEGSYFEDELRDLCVMDARSDELGKRETTKLVVASVVEDRGEEGDIEESGVSDNEQHDMPPTPDTVPITTSTAMQETCDEIDAADTVEIESSEKSSNSSLRTSEYAKRRGTTTDEAASFNTSDRKSKNCATFYFKHLDTDSEADGVQPIQESPAADDSSEEEWTYTSSRQNSSAVSEQRKTNVVVRCLDFDESPRVGPSENMRFAQKTNAADDSGTTVVAQVRYNDSEQKDSDDERNNDKSSVQRLIKEVENLIGEERHAGASRTFPPLMFEEKDVANNHRAKYARVKKWLKLNATRSHEGRSQPLDSCDASGEYTTEESDGERQSIPSDDLQSSVATYRRFEGALSHKSQSPSMSQEIFDFIEKTPVNEAPPNAVLDASTPRVVMRSRQKAKGSRPWSVSCISQIENNPNLAQINDPISQFSISETALHQLVTTPPTKSVSLDAAGSRKSFNNSTSTLLEESIICSDARNVVRNISFRRKKNRLRKKTLGRKSEFSSESTHVIHHSAESDGSSNQQRSSRKMNRTVHAISKDCLNRSTTLVKSGSFSGCTAHQQLYVEKALANNPTSFRLLCCKSVASTSETEGEDRNNCTQGHFTYDNNLLSTVLNSKELSNQQLNMDSDVEMNSLGNNSFFEQAWDNYQEKYMSETYSEASDVETARRLLDFADDYRNFLDSQSDCASSMSAIPTSSSKTRTYHDNGDSSEDSYSDEEDPRNVAENLQSQLAENTFIKPNGVIPVEFAEVESACKENLGCSQTVSESQNVYCRIDKHLKEIHGMFEKEETSFEQASTVHQKLLVTQVELRKKHNLIFDYEMVKLLEQPSALDDRINRITAELAVMKEYEPVLSTLRNYRHKTKCFDASLTTTEIYKDMEDLCELWNDISKKGNQQLCTLQAVQQFGTRLAELQSALQRDKDALVVLDVALQAGATSEVASSVRHVARLLCEIPDINCQNDSVLSDSTTEEVLCGSLSKFVGATANNLTQEGGSFSDSGISDSGSEQELSERERRLAALRRLTRSLEAQLAPGSKALTERLCKRIKDVEIELRDLQKQCRELIERIDAPSAAKRTASQVHYVADKRKKASDCDTSVSKCDPEFTLIAKCGVADVAKDENLMPHNWVWRIFKVAMPFQLALVALFCAAWLLYPHCCETINTFNSWFFMPQLHNDKQRPV